MPLCCSIDLNDTVPEEGFIPLACFLSRGRAAADGLKKPSASYGYVEKAGRQGCDDRRVAMDGDRELTGTYWQRVGTALPASLVLPRHPQQLLLSAARHLHRGCDHGPVHPRTRHVPLPP